MICPPAKLLEAFQTPSDTPFVIEHVNEEFTSVCPCDGASGLWRHHAAVSAPRGKIRGGEAWVRELKSLKMYYQSFRNEGNLLRGGDESHSG